MRFNLYLTFSLGFAASCVTAVKLNPGNFPVSDIDQEFAQTFG